MRMEELAENRYVKNTDSVERYLLHLVQNYFQNNDAAPENSREAIIEKALIRMKEEIDFESVGVLSITLPDGKERIGAVQISIEDLGGEPAIVPKYSAFNVNFGTIKGTACEGNDPRLSDDRYPLAHEHSIDDVMNLANELSTINGKIDRLHGHEHTNKSSLDKITYSGTKSLIDLADIENLEDTISRLIEEIQNDISSYRSEITGKIIRVNDDIEIIRDEIAEIQRYVIETNNQHKQEAIEHANTEIQIVKEEIDEALANFVTKTMLVDVLRIASNAYVFFNKINVNFSDILSSGKTSYRISDENIINQINEIHLSSLTNEDVVIETTMRLNNRTYTLPYVVYEDNSIKGFITPARNGLDVVINLECDLSDIPNDLSDAVITVSYYIRQPVTII